MPTMLHKGLLGRKIGMTRVFLANGDAVACTLVEAGPCTVVQRKTTPSEGYEAIQIGFLPKRETRVSKPLRGHFKRAGTDPLRHLAEVRLSEGDSAPDVGQKVTCDVFPAGSYVDVIGTMKGRGTQGVVRRHGFSTMKESHGAHFFVRHSGSVGCRKPQHTVKGTRMGGQYGNSPVTVQNLQILRVEPERNLLYIKGAVPGANRGLLYVRQARKRPGA